MNISRAKTNHPGGHRQRLRDRFILSGLQGFRDYEVIELLLSLGTPRKDCKFPTKESIKLFGSLGAVLEGPAHDL